MRWLWIALLMAGCESSSPAFSAPPPPPSPAPPPKAPPAVKLRRRRLVWPEPPAPIDPPSPGYSGLVLLDGETPGTRVFEGGVLVAEVDAEVAPEEVTDARSSTLFVGTILSVWGATPGQLVHALGLSDGGPVDAQYACDPMGANESSEAYVGPQSADGEVLVMFGNPRCGDGGGEEGDAARSLLEALSARFGRCAVASCNKYAVYYWGCAEGGKIERFVATGALEDARAWWFEGEERPDEEAAQLRMKGKYDASWPDPALKWLQQWRVAQGAAVVADEPIELPGPGIAGYVGLRWAAEG